MGADGTDNAQTVTDLHLDCYAILGVRPDAEQLVIREIERISKPGRRVYTSVRNLPRINNGLGVAIVSTPKGVMADHDARDANVGGEILCTVF